MRHISFPHILNALTIYYSTSRAVHKRRGITGYENHAKAKDAGLKVWFHLCYLFVFVENLTIYSIETIHKTFSSLYNAETEYLIVSCREWFGIKNWRRLGSECTVNITSATAQILEPDFCFLLMLLQWYSSCRNNRLKIWLLYEKIRDRVPSWCINVVLFRP